MTVKSFQGKVIEMLHRHLKEVDGALLILSKTDVVLLRKFQKNEYDKLVESYERKGE